MVQFVYFSLIYSHRNSVLPVNRLDMLANGFKSKSPAQCTRVRMPVRMRGCMCVCVSYLRSNLVPKGGFSGSSNERSSDSIRASLISDLPAKLS